MRSIIFFLTAVTLAALGTAPGGGPRPLLYAGPDIPRFQQLYLHQHGAMPGHSVRQTWPTVYRKPVLWAPGTVRLPA